MPPKAFGLIKMQGFAKGVIPGKVMAKPAVRPSVFAGDELDGDDDDEKISNIRNGIGNPQSALLLSVDANK
jgi:hypothetical protein